RAEQAGEARKAPAVEIGGGALPIGHRKRLASAAMDRRSRIEARLRAELVASHVDVADESHLHAGHAGAAWAGGRFGPTIVSGRLGGPWRVARQRLVSDALAAEMRTEIHAPAMRTFTAAEWAAARD